MRNVKQMVIIVGCTLLVGLTLFFTVFGVVHVFSNWVNSLHQVAAYKHDAFVGTYPSDGKNVLEIEGDVVAQIKYARQFFQDYYTVEGDTYSYQLDDNSKMIKIITADQYRVNSFGDYVMNE